LVLDWIAGVSLVKVELLMRGMRAGEKKSKEILAIDKTIVARLKRKRKRRRVDQNRYMFQEKPFTSDVQR